ncbi:MAG: hypothetical protein K6T75_11710, partial [Acetobacteraceae bacterium]|nr:hypothetical protein [Acetobacteraceae bacterium]
MKPFSSLVRHPGNASLFRAAEMSILATREGYPFHLHAEGVRGTGKTTILRAARALLPPIERVRGCLYNCSPRAPHCPAHRDLSRRELDTLGTEYVPMPFLEVSPSAKVGTVAGSIDLARIVDPSRPQAALLPGTIPQAHRGILFVDEVNRLADIAPELADVLLDVMGTRPGRIQVEETGVPRVEMAVCVSVWAASNPDEEPGPLEEIRRQLSDRFDLVVPVRRPGRRELVEQILSLCDPWAEPSQVAGAQNRGAAPLASALALLPAAQPPSPLPEEGVLARVLLPPELRVLIASLYVEFGLESLRAVEALQVGSRLAAALAGREAVALEDLLFVAPLVLEHRVEPQTLPRVLRFLEAWREEQAADRGPAAAGGGAPGRGAGAARGAQ